MLMKKFQRTLSITLAAIMLAMPFSVSAEAAVSDSQLVSQIISGYIEYDNDYTVFYNNMESYEGEYRGNFPIMVLEAGNKGICMWQNKAWVGMKPSRDLAGVTYKYKGQTFDFMNEQYKADTYYLGAYDYRVKETYQQKNDAVFSLCPRIEPLFSTADNDYRMSPTVSINWQTVKFAFKDTVSGNLDMMLNNLGSNCQVYFDNIRLIEATTVSLDNEMIEINDLANNILFSDERYNKTGENMVALGAPCCFTLSSKSASIKPAKVTMGGQEIIPTANGTYIIPSVTGEIVIEASYKDVAFDNVAYYNDKIYLSQDVSIADFLNKIGVNEYAVKIDGQKVGKAPVDCSASNNNVEFMLGDQSKQSVLLAPKGDTSGNGELDVTDIIKINDYILERTADEETPICADMNSDGIISVSDVVLIRKGIMINSATPSAGTLERMQEGIDGLVLEADDNAVRITEEMISRSVYNYGNRARFADVLNKADKGEEITIAYFGCSISQGGNASAELVTNNGYVSRLSSWFSTVFPDAKINTINASYGGTNSIFGLYRMEADVLKYNPDIIIIEYDCNDSNYSLRQQSTYESMVRKAINSGAATMIYSFKQANVALKSSQEMHEPIADFYDLPMVSYRDAYEQEDFFPYYDSANKGKVSSDGVHPNDVGYAIATVLFERFFMDVYKDMYKINQSDIALTDNYFNNDAVKYDDNSCNICNIGEVLTEEGDTVTLDNGVVVKLESLGGFKVNTDYETKVQFPAYINGSKIEDVTQLEGSKIAGYDDYVHSYKGYTASNYKKQKPVIFKIENVRIIDVLKLRNANGSYANFYVNGNKSIFDYQQYGSGNVTWATDQVYYSKTPSTVILEVFPELGKDGDVYKMLALMLG